MIKHIILVFALLFSLSISAKSVISEIKYPTEVVNSEFYEKLKALDKVVSVEKLKTDLFSEKYLIKVEQPIDHTDFSKGTFTQRVIVSHSGYENPVVLVCEGYGATSVMKPTYKEELTTKLGANQVFVEHRYFLESTPEDCDWQYMTGKNAAADLHNINNMLKELYSGKWISTGISKGGHNTMIYRTYYPDDVDFSVPYVGPVCFGVEDGRHEPYIANCGTEEERTAILEFQKEILRRKEALNPMLYAYAEEKNMNFRIPKEEVLDYCVLEYSFSFWQWGSKISEIPALDSSDKELFDYLMKLSGAEYFGIPSHEPFFVQAYAELGYYGYDIKPFKGLLTIDSSKGYLERAFLPEEAKNLKFNHELHKDIYSFLKKNDPKMIFIYGEVDPWSAVMPNEKLFKGKNNMKLYIKERGSHSTRISSMDEDVKNEIWNQINDWLNE
ncbi:MAG: S28 family serine protease [Rikenellaceae bacterium]